MKNISKISVIIPTYNRESLITRSIKSVLNQTYTNIEVIVVDDCSTDNTEKVIKKIRDKRLKYIKLEENRGACHARNVGIENATGDYIAFQDSDDVFHKNKLEKQLNNLIKNNSDFDFCKLNIFVHNIKWHLPDKEQDKILNEDTFLYELCKGNFISTQTILAKKEVFNDIKFDERLPRFQDYDLVLRVANKFKISYTKQSLVDVYRQNDSISTSHEKLERACIIMLNKDYAVDDTKNNLLTKTLIKWASNDLNDKNRELSKNFNDLNAKYEELDKKYSNIINSRRWIWLNKVLKIIGK